MKIGVDVRLLSRSLTGIGRYTLENCLALSKISDISLNLYSPSSICSDKFSLESAVVKDKNWNSAILRQLWSETYLPVWIKKDNVDVFWGPAHRLPRLMSKEIARVVTIHDLVWKFFANSMRLSTRFLDYYQMPFAINSADKIVVDSQSTADAVLKEFRVHREKISVVSPGSRVGKQIDHSAAVLPTVVNQPYFLFVGTLEPRKNLLRLLNAYHQLPLLSRSKMMLVIVGGEGWGGIDISVVVRQLGLQDRVRILGYVDEAILTALYANALFLAFPSLYEGFGLPIIEAMSYGKPVLTSNNSAMPEVAGDAGLLVDALSTDSIRIGLEKMICNDQLRDLLASRAKKNAARFDWDNSAEKLVQVFQEAITVRKGYLS